MYICTIFMSQVTSMHALWFNLVKGNDFWVCLLPIKARLLAIFRIYFTTPKHGDGTVNPSSGNYGLTYIQQLMAQISLQDTNRELQGLQQVQLKTIPRK